MNLQDKYGNEITVGSKVTVRDGSGELHIGTVVSIGKPKNSQYELPFHSGEVSIPSWIEYCRSWTPDRSLIDHPSKWPIQKIRRPATIIKVRRLEGCLVV